uniref:Putative phospholipase n=2 Tax=Brachypodium sylvaticum TaxID=29664 RepID=Q2L3E4_BRASY|nr:putative phospholipase [Brachypodium sylvaticum]
MERAVRELWAESRDLLGLHSPEAVPRADLPPTPLAFLRDHVSPGRPLLVSAAATRHWPAASLWPTESYLTDALRSTDVSVHLTPDGRADALAPHPCLPGARCFASAHVRRVDFPTAVRLIRGSDRAAAGGLVAYAQQQDDCLRGEYAAVAGDVDAHVPWASEALGCLPEAVNLWIGNSCSVTSFHKDHYDNVYAVLSGEKHFLLLPPTEHHRLYVRDYPAARYVTENEGEEELTGLKLEMEEPERIVPWSSVDPNPSSPEEMAAQVSSFPLYFEGPRPIRCTVRAGEVLYLPSMWFHHVSQSPGPNGLTIAVNYWYDMQFDIKYAYFNFLRSLEISNSPLDNKDAALEGDLEEKND